MFSFRPGHLELEPELEPALVPELGELSFPHRECSMPCLTWFTSIDM